ncbi:MAG TPA: long-chain fatty acid--CoA ligase [Cyclobacteriaceae bacterium]|nr:long-chain fatty acid--CoA ligase [Cyclobacteriaceae bacterium]
MEITKKKGSDFTRVFDILSYQVEKYPNAAALNFFSGNKWKAIAIQEIVQRADALSCWLLRRGFKKDDRMIVIPYMGNPWWMIIDYACQQIGMITVPMHPASRIEDWILIVKETQAKMAVTADHALCEKLKKASDEAHVDMAAWHLQQYNIGFFEAIHEDQTDPGELKKLMEMKKSVAEDDTCTILYTSGSSGVPKGVLLTHRNIVFNIKQILTLIPLDPGQRVLSFLPFSHIFERTTCYTYVAFGVSLYFSQSKESFAADFRSVRPHFCTAVPRVLEKMYDYLEEQMLGKNILKRKVIAWALDVGKKYGQSRFDLWYQSQLSLARLLVLGQWRRKLGGKIRHIITGAASLQPEIAKLFWAAGIQVIEGYGMTETAPLITVNRFEPGMHRFGTVGLTIPGIEVRIDSPDENGEGEILVKGPNVTPGYYNHPEQTRLAFNDEGWFKTGDVGKFVLKRFLQITDRKKEIFKTSSGKYIAPLQLQNHFMTSPLIERCLVIGFQRPFVTALILPNFLMLEKWCRQEHIHWTAPQFMVHNIMVRTRLDKEIEILNESLPNFERIRNFVLCHEDWTADNGEVTATLKPVRHVLEEHYKSEIEKMYE